MHKTILRPLDFNSHITVKLKRHVLVMIIVFECRSAITQQMASSVRVLQNSVCPIPTNTSGIIERHRRMNSRWVDATSQSILQL
jgi:lysyl-tRNA synthetase class II